MRRRGHLTNNELRMINAKISDEEAFEKFERDCHLRNLRPAPLNTTEMNKQPLSDL